MEDKEGLMLLKLPPAFWLFLICINAGVFGVGFYFADRSLMLLSLLSFLSCFVSYYIGVNKDGEK